jgi:hypothetical protein
MLGNFTSKTIAMIQLVLGEKIVEVKQLPLVVCKN